MGLWERVGNERKGYHRGLGKKPQTKIETG